QVWIFWPKKGELVHLDARTISPDGSSTTLDTADLFASEIKASEKEELGMRTFHFPHVEVGSIIELTYTIEADGYYVAWSEDVADEIPVRDYKLDIAIDAKDKPAIRVLNASVTPSYPMGDDGLRHTTFEMWNVP